MERMRVACRMPALAAALRVYIRRTRLLGATWVYEGGCMMVRAGDPINRMKDLKGKKVGLSKSLNTVKNDWWHITEHQGIESMLRLNDMTMEDVQIVEFPYPNNWYSDAKMLAPMINPTDLWATRDHKQDLAFRPLEMALLNGKVDAIYTLSKRFRAPPGGDRQDEGDRRPNPVSGLDPPGRQHAGDHHLHRCHGREASGTCRHLHEEHDQGGALGQRAQAGFGPDIMKIYAAGVVLPFLPLLLLKGPLAELAAMMVKRLFGG